MNAVNSLGHKKNRSYYILSGFFILVLTVFTVGSEGLLRYFSAMFILFLMGMNLVLWAREITEDEDIWKHEEVLKEEIDIRLGNTSNLVKRASKGMRVSRGLLERKIKDIFLSKLQVERNLSRDEVNKLIRYPDKFRDVVKDDTLADFVLADEDDAEEDVREDEEYEEWLSEIMERIDRWG